MSSLLGALGPWTTYLSEYDNIIFMKQIIDMSTAENVMEKKDDNNFDTINDRHVLSSLFSF